MGMGDVNLNEDCVFNTTDFLIGNLNSVRVFELDSETWSPSGELKFEVEI
jgi:hypothetical protein